MASGGAGKLTLRSSFKFGETTANPLLLVSVITLSTDQTASDRSREADTTMLPRQSPPGVEDRLYVRVRVGARVWGRFLFRVGVEVRIHV